MVNDTATLRKPNLISAKFRERGSVREGIHLSEEVRQAEPEDFFTSNTLPIFFASQISASSLKSRGQISLQAIKQHYWVRHRQRREQNDLLVSSNSMDDEQAMLIIHRTDDAIYQSRFEIEDEVGRPYRLRDTNLARAFSDDISFEERAGTNNREVLRMLNRRTILQLAAILALAVGFTASVFFQNTQIGAFFVLGLILLSVLGERHG
ncbi:MAG: hypothetical protein RLO08_10925 [Parvibaculaceae bacterium]